jgi:hypothetical protein
MVLVDKIPNRINDDLMIGVVATGIVIFSMFLAPKDSRQCEMNKIILHFTVLQLFTQLIGLDQAH